MELVIIDEKAKHCAWQYLGKNYRKECPSCPDYDVNCRDYIPLLETQVESVMRIKKQLNLSSIL